jgi:membrane dipeptidase
VLVSVFLSIEYFDGVFNADSVNVEKYRKMGIRSITLVDNDIDIFFRKDQLTKFGKQTIHKMNKAGILVDITHLSENHMIEVIRFSVAPVIASHSCARTVSGNRGSLSDEVLEALKENKGYVFTT